MPVVKDYIRLITNILVSILSVVFLYMITSTVLNKLKVVYDSNVREVVEIRKDIYYTLNIFYILVAIVCFFFVRYGLSELLIEEETAEETTGGDEHAHGESSKNQYLSLRAPLAWLIWVLVFYLINLFTGSG